MSTRWRAQERWRQVLLRAQYKRAWPWLILVPAVVACPLVYPRGGPAAILAVLVSVVCVAVVAALLAGRNDRAWIVIAAVLAIGCRDLLVGAVDVALLRTGAQVYAPDESTYFSAAISLAHHWRDAAAPFDASNYYNSSQYVLTIARLFYVFGDNLVLAKLFNTFLAVIAALLIYPTMRNLGMAGARWGTILFLWFPSFAFWSALGLKEAYVVFFLVAAVWTSSEFVRRGNVLWLAATAVSLLAIESVRTYIFVVGCLAWIGLALAVSGWRRRLVTGGAVTIAVLVLFVLTQPFKDLGPNPFYIPVVVRAFNAQYGNSAFIEPPPTVTGQPGERLVVSVPNVTTAPGFSPREVVVPPGAEVVIDTSTAGPTAAPAVAATDPQHRIVVRPGDVIVIGGVAAASPAPGSSARAVVLDPAAKNTVGAKAAGEDLATSASASIRANLSALPLGVFFSLFAPFPWSPAHTLEQLAAIPEMILWYACLVFAVVGLIVLIRKRDLRYAQGAATAAGLILVLGLVEANTGTLIRSREMLVPFVLMLTGVGLDATFRRRASRRRWPSWLA